MCYDVAAMIYSVITLVFISLETTTLNILKEEAKTLNRVVCLNQMKRFVSNQFFKYSFLFSNLQIIHRYTAVVGLANSSLEDPAFVNCLPFYLVFFSVLIYF